MLDNVLGFYASRKYSQLDDGYKPDMAITSSNLVNANGANLTVLFPPWRGGDIAYDLLAKRLIRNGSAVLRYKFNPQILEPNVNRVLASFNFIQNKVIDDLTKLIESRKFGQINLVASSLGNVSLGLVAKNFPHFTNTTMVVAGSNLAKSAWRGARTQHIRNTFEQQGFTEDMLDEAWASVAPKSAVNSFSGKPVHLLMSVTDTVIPTIYQQEMLEELHMAGAITTIDSYNSGHIATVARYCLTAQHTNY